MTPMESSGFLLDSNRRSRLSSTEKRELVRQVALSAEDAPVILTSFTRKDLLEIICAEMGKERKYSGWSKSQMIEKLLKLVNGERSNVDIPTNNRPGFSGLRQDETRVPLFADLNVVPAENIKVCENAACRANLSMDDVFCRKCSCYICHGYDENKDPSLWLTCFSDSAGDDSCGFTCHLICALEDGKREIINGVSGAKLDCSFCCVACGMVNDLMGTWKKQLLLAKEARRVDVLCLRVLLGFRILTGTKKYEEVRKIVETALEMLVKELGPSDLVSAKMARGIVSRLSCGSQVQKLCADALEAYDLTTFRASPDNMESESLPCNILFEGSSPNSVVLVFDYADPSEDFGSLSCRLWHRKSTVKDYPEKGLAVIAAEKRFELTGLSPATEYFFKVLLLNSRGVIGTCEAKYVTSSSNGSSITSLCKHRNQENTAAGKIRSQTKTRKTKAASGGQLTQKSSAKDSKKRRNNSLSARRSRIDRIFSMPSFIEETSGTIFESHYPPKPCQANEASEMSGCCIKGEDESDYEYSVRVIKWLEQRGLITEDFRVKFLTWFSLKASMEVRRVVNAYLDCFVDDPTSLAGQLVHTFKDEIRLEQKRLPPGFCYRLWH